MQAHDIVCTIPTETRLAVQAAGSRCRRTLTSSQSDGLYITLNEPASVMSVTANVQDTAAYPLIALPETRETKRKSSGETCMLVETMRRMRRRQRCGAVNL